MSATYIDELSQTFSLDCARTALVITDLQYASGSREHGLGRYLAQIGRREEAAYRFDRIERLVVPNAKRLLAGFRNVEAAVIYLTIGANRPDYVDAPPYMRNFFKACNNHVGTREHEILDDLSPEVGEPILRKTTQGAFASTGLDSLLRSLYVEQLVFVGVSTNKCVESTAREAADRGYSVALVSDATGTCDDEFQRVTLDGFRRLWGRVMETDEVLAEISRSKVAAE